MGKNLIQQARGKGSPTYRAPSFKYKGRAKHLSLMKEGQMEGKVVDLITCRGHSTPLTRIVWANGEKTLGLAVDGILVGQKVSAGQSVQVTSGNILSLADIPEGSLVNNIESHPGDGGKFVRASGTFARVVGKSDGKVTLLLPSKKEKIFNESCRATIGVLAAGGRPEKPFYKAGRKYFKMKAKNKLYPKVSGVAMNSVDHPFGGSSSAHKGRPTLSSKNAPPGRKVGKLRPRRTGIRKK
ncbi:MAG: 50S ribosomal protein L2 [DPANN group archaeon]|nr:50S ribosomal protein L2 [DPANN group archaeon]